MLLLILLVAVKNWAKKKILSNSWMKKTRVRNSSQACQDRESVIRKLIVNLLKPDAKCDKCSHKDKQCLVDHSLIVNLLKPDAKCDKCSHKH